MNFESMDLDQLANYLNRDSRELDKLARRGHLPGQRVGGEWRFAQAEINLWVESQLSSWSDTELVAIERDDQPLITPMLGESTIAIPLLGNTKSSVLRELVTLAEQSWQVYDPDALLTSIRQREDAGSTALDNGVAIPHPNRRSLPSTVLGDSVVALGVLPRGLPFGASNGGMTDIVVLVACTDAATHLRTLTRLSRMFLRPGFLDSLRAAENPAEIVSLVAACETAILNSE